MPVTHQDESDSSDAKSSSSKESTGPAAADGESNEGADVLLVLFNFARNRSSSANVSPSREFFFFARRDLPLSDDHKYNNNKVRYRNGNANTSKSSKRL